MAYLNLFFGGLLAGAEVVVRLGVRGPLARLDQRAHIELRQGLVRTLRILVPGLFLPALVAGAAVALGGGWFRLAGVALLLVWAGTTFLGAVPINAAVLGWDPAAPPADWVARVDRWERLNTVRTIAVVASFAAFLTAA